MAIVTYSLMASSFDEAGSGQACLARRAADDDTTAHFFFPWFSAREGSFIEVALRRSSEYFSARYATSALRKSSPISIASPVARRPPAIVEVASE